MNMESAARTPILLNSTTDRIEQELNPTLLVIRYLFRSGFKTSDQVQGLGVRPIGKAQSRQRRDEQYVYRRPATQPLGLDGVLKPLLDKL